MTAEVIARFGKAIRPRPTRLPDAATQALEAHVERRRQVVTMITAEKNRLSSAAGLVRKDIQRHIAWLEKELRKLDEELSKRIRENRRHGWQRGRPAQESNKPGVGRVLGATLLAEVPEHRRSWIGLKQIVQPPRGRPVSCRDRRGCCALRACRVGMDGRRVSLSDLLVRHPEHGLRPRAHDPQ